MKNEVIGNINSIINKVTFDGERVAKMNGVSEAEAIRLGVHLIDTGEQSRAKGVFVLAEKIKPMNEKDAKAFRDAIKYELASEAKARAMQILPSDDDVQAATLRSLPAGAGEADKIKAVSLALASEAKRREEVKTLAAESAATRFRNLQSGFDAAIWMLTHPELVANSTSVWTVVQAGKAREALPANPTPEEKAKHAAVLPLLASGASQAEVKKAVAAAKESAKPAAPVETRTPEQIKEDGRQGELMAINRRLHGIFADWERLVSSGTKPEELRGEPKDRSKPGKDTTKDIMGILAKLAGVTK